MESKMENKSENGSDWVATIGLEIHAELATASKMFCACKNDPDEEKPNANICPICMGHPGTLPTLNHEAIKKVLKIGYAAHGTIADFTEWDRKNYFYPDIPKGYQISQYKFPLIVGGKIAGVALTRIHLEEDTAQSTHDTMENAGVDVENKSLVNFNRAGVPLMELVTEPDIHDSETAVRFAKELQLLLRYLGAGEANLEKGEMRVEANISVASAADTAARKFGTKTEVKNLNSFRAVERAIAYEIARQTNILEANAAGDNSLKIVQETRGWDEGGQKTFSQRAKESAHDYRYFPDPDIPKLKVSEIADFAADKLRAELPELPWQKRERYARDFGMTDKEVAVFVEEKKLANYFEQLIKHFVNEGQGDSKNNEKSGEGNKQLIRLSVNYLLSDYVGFLKKKYGEGNFSMHIDDVSPENFAELIDLVSSTKINSRGAKDILLMMIEAGDTSQNAAQNKDKNDGKPLFLAEKHGLIQKNDEGELSKIANEIVTANPQVVADFKAGKAAALQFLIGQGMKATKGGANPEILKKVFLKVLA